MKNHLQSQALDLYMAGQPQKHIATTLGISEKTLYTWIKQNEWQQLRKAALTAPAVIVNNMYSQLIELQTTIAGREEGQRYPDASEAEITRKLVNSIIKMKEHPSLGTSIQILMSFSNYMQQIDPEFNKQMVTYADTFIKSKAKNGFKSYQVEYEMNDYPQETVPEENQPEAQPESENQQAETTEIKKTAEPENNELQQSETIDNTAPQPKETITTPPAKPVKSGKKEVPPLAAPKQLTPAVPDIFKADRQQPLKRRYDY